jgi:small-conductance mechanosensitive channel
MRWLARASPTNAADPSMIDLQELFQREFMHNAAWRWLLAGLIAAVAVSVALGARRLLRRQYERLAATPQLEMGEVPLRMLGRTGVPFLVSAGLFLGLLAIELPERVRGGLVTAITVISFLQLGIWATAGIVAWAELKRKHAMTTDRAAAGSLGIINFIAQVVVWSLVALLTLDNLGVDITALVAGLGIGGIAVALALQNVLGDLLASLSIALDRPFVVGDFIIVGEFMGTVEQIGIKSCRVRGLGGEQIAISNTDLLGSRLRNYGRMLERRVLFTLGITYETPLDKLKQIPELIAAAVRAQEQTRFERSHFAKYGAFSLDFETVYHVLSPDYGKHMDIQQAVFFAIHESFERAGIEFAYPTQKLWLAMQVAGTALEPGPRADGGAQSSEH